MVQLLTLSATWLLLQPLTSLSSTLLPHVTNSPFLLSTLTGCPSGSPSMRNNFSSTPSLLTSYLMTLPSCSTPSRNRSPMQNQAPYSKLASLTPTLTGELENVLPRLMSPFSLTTWTHLAPLFASAPAPEEYPTLSPPKGPPSVIGAVSLAILFNDRYWTTQPAPSAPSTRRRRMTNERTMSTQQAATSTRALPAVRYPQ